MTIIDLNTRGISNDDRLHLLQDTESVTVRVGTGVAKQSWTIQKKLLTHDSAFFAAVLNGSFSEAITNTIELTDDDPRAFKFFVQWLYTGKFSLVSCRDGELYIDESKMELGDIPNFLCVVWGLGDKLNCPAFQDHAMLQMLTLHEDIYLQQDVVADAYKTSAPGSKLRKFVVDQFLHEIRFGLNGKGGDLRTPAQWDIESIDLDNFNRDVLGRLIETKGERFNPPTIGWHYLEVLNYEDHKCECRRM
ncbi:MAG: hypothetical protein Q9213_003857 [Squamulea squamosa]